jgi:hypothetical protein
LIPSKKPIKQKENPFCNSALESRALEQYWNEKGGRIYTEFNTAYGFEGKMRTLDAIRFPELEKGMLRARNRYEEIKSLVAKYEVELIEVHHWGFYGFGQLIGKSEIFAKYWSPKSAKKVLIILSPKEFHPQTKPDPLTEEVFKKFAIEVYVPIE